MEQVLSNPYLVEMILKFVPDCDLVKCSKVNWTWNKEAVKILDRKAIVNLGSHDHNEVCSCGGRRHGHRQIALDCRHRKYRNGRFQQRHEMTDDEIQSLISAIQILDLSKIKAPQASSRYS